MEYCVQLDLTDFFCLFCCFAETMRPTQHNVIRCHSNCTAWFNRICLTQMYSCKYQQYRSKCKPTLVWSCLCAPLVSNCPTVKKWRATPWNKTALALTIPMSMLVSLLFCLSGVTGKFKCSAAFKLPGEEATQYCDHANSPVWKIQEPNDNPRCADADRGRKRGTTWRSKENCESTVSACRLR